MDDDLDQVFTSATAAMAFVLINWQNFEQFCLERFERVPVSRWTMRDHALQITGMTDPERMPS